jgi:hypothetical protein
VPRSEVGKGCAIDTQSHLHLHAIIMPLLADWRP